jgi:hypothetical protein
MSEAAMTDLRSTPVDARRRRQPQVMPQGVPTDPRVIARWLLLIVVVVIALIVALAVLAMQLAG